MTAGRGREGGRSRRRGLWEARGEACGGGGRRAKLCFRRRRRTRLRVLANSRVCIERGRGGRACTGCDTKAIKETNKRRDALRQTSGAHAVGEQHRGWRGEGAAAAVCASVRILVESGRREAKRVRATGRGCGGGGMQERCTRWRARDSVHRPSGVDERAETRHNK